MKCMGTPCFFFFFFLPPFLQRVTFFIPSIDYPGGGGLSEMRSILQWGLTYKNLWKGIFRS